MGTEIDEAREKVAVARASSCTCRHCVRACQRLSGHFLPGDAERAAEAMGIPWDEFRGKLLVVDYWHEEHDDKTRIYAYRPRGAMDGDGMLARYAARAGRCTFLDANDRCSIHAVKPIECAAALCCGPDGAHVEEFDKPGVFDAWRKAGNPLREWVESRDFLRAEFEVNSGDAIAVLGPDLFVEVGGYAEEEVAAATRSVIAMLRDAHGHGRRRDRAR